MRAQRNAAGFTLIEMIVVIVLSGIIVSFVGLNISRPVQSFVDTSRRAALTDAAQTAANRLIRETRLALPNSVRINGNTAIEFLRTRSGGRYRLISDPLVPSDPLDFVGTDSRFDVLGELKNFGQICAATTPSCGGSAASSANCMTDPDLDCLVVYNTGQPANCAALPAARSNAYCGDNVAGIDRVDNANSQIDFVHDDGTFPLTSPNQRFHIVDTPVSYICDLGNGTLSRYDRYPIAANQPSLASPPASAARVLVNSVTACEFSYDPGSATRAALVQLSLTLADPDAPTELIRLFQQTHVPNVP